MAFARISRFSGIICLLISACILYGAIPACTQAATVYKVIDLGAFEGGFSEAHSINEAGQIVGAASNSEGVLHATLFDSTGAGDNIGLGTLGSIGSDAIAINDFGQIVGDAGNIENYIRAVLFDASGAGKNIDLGTLGGRHSEALSINNSGQIVGWSEGNNSEWPRYGYYATLFDPTGDGNNINLGTLGGNESMAIAINNTGQIIGWSGTSQGWERATLFDPTGEGNNVDLGALGGFESMALAINNSGQIVGRSYDKQRSMHAALFDSTGGGKNINLSPSNSFGSEATAINDAGQIVGSSQVDFFFSWRAMLFDPTGDGNNIDLNTLIDPASGWTLTQAKDINNTGWIVGNGINPQGQQHAFLLVPISTKYGGGTGEPNDPYQIATAEDLMLLGEIPEDYDKHFILTDDIDLDPNLPGRKVFDKAVIAPDMDPNDEYSSFQGTPFTGVFDGNGYTISNLTHESNSVDFIGLFGHIDDPNAEIRNLRLINPNIYAEEGGFVGSLVGWFVEGTLSSCYVERHTVAGSFCVGGLVGENLRGTIHSCRVSGDVIGKYTLGGLVGRNREGAIINCHVNINVSGGHSSSFIGGLVGDNAMTTDYFPIPGTSGGWIFNCCTTGSVSGGDNSDSIGGLVGYFGDGSITNSYSTAHVTGGKKSMGLGGLVGDIGTILGDDGGWITNCFATGVVTYGEGSSYIGGLVGSIWLGGISNSFWDVETTGQTASDGGTGKTTAQMQDINTYLTAGWDFIGEAVNGTSDIWRMSENGGYPVLNIFQGFTPILPVGRGTAEEPFLIDSVEELGLILYYPLACYRLDSDIDLSEIVWSTAVTPWFGGYFDGNGHMLSNLSVQGGGHIGLFGTLDRDAVVMDLGIENVSIKGMGDFIGGFVGDNYGSVSDCYIIGTVSGNDALSVGGLVGYNSGDVTRCYSSGEVHGGSQVGGLIGLGSATHCYSTATVSGNRYVGGLVGFAGNVKYCYSAGEISGDKYVGGLVGYSFWSQLTQCYSTGAVNGIDSVGGLVGYSQNGSIIHCYSTGVVSGSSNVGGLMGQNERGTVLDCFWDIETSNQNTSAGGIGKTTAAMQDIQTYLDGGWDFVEEIGNGTHQIWQMPEGDGYPILSIFSGYTPLQLNGLGTADDPYLISNALELGAMIYYSSYAHYRLDSSIDLLGICWSTAVIPAFEGTFDGNNLTISNLTIKGVRNLALFERLAPGAEIKDLELVNINITGLGEFVGGLAVYNYGTITHCYSTGTGAISGEEGVGGLVGYNHGTITYCCSTGSVHGSEGWAVVGGLMGSNDGTVIQCYSTGAVSGNSSAGGLMSHNYGTVTQCYSTGEVSGREWVGGLVGFNYGTVIQCYSTGTVFGGSDVGGLIGYKPYNGYVTNCFWDTQTSGQTESDGGMGKTTAEMQTASTFLEAGWDFLDETTNGTEDIWWILEGQDYPRLWWQTKGN